MSREQRYNAILLKKQPLGEGDELLTFFSEENGKMRALAKSTKLAKSKLAYSLQTLFQVRLTLSGASALPRVIGAEVFQTFAGIRESLEAANSALYAVELTLKFTPDEQKNEQLFALVAAFFSFLSEKAKNSAVLNVGVAKFKIDFLEAMGFSVSRPEGSAEKVYFSNSKGGFVVSDGGADHVPLSAPVLEQFLILEQESFSNIGNMTATGIFAGGNCQELQEVLGGFLRYQLERDLKSERYLGVI